MKNSTEEHLWKEVNWELMSEESEVDEETMQKRGLPFRSEGKLTMLKWFAFLFSACSSITSAEQTN